MLNVIFNDTETVYKVSFSISENVIKLIGDIPKNTSGFTLFTESGIRLGGYPNYTTIHEIVDGGYRFSDDGSIYVPPIIPDPVEPTDPPIIIDPVPTQEERLIAIELSLAYASASFAEFTDFYFTTNPE